ncbi:MAG: AzlD domain-containing protein [Pelagibacteraceae bacterium]|jgi:branched-subunit amino acid transport protein|uniref:AzlD domain-containing protein n=1 Tax=Candidatus Pelagibacter sp. HIMB1517 TaxID=3413341 RepID=UPI0001BB44FA|nr:branched-chain amino acid transport protein [alpha proteobacterium HIMB114]
MSIWTYTIIIGILTFLSRYVVTAYANTKTYSETTKKVLSYVPSAVFPSLIFPAVFYENNNLVLFSSEIQAFILAFIVSVIFKNIFLTVSVGILSYILIIFG